MRRGRPDEGLGGPTEAMKCIHRWLVASEGVAGTWPASCRYCGATRRFSGGAPDRPLRSAYPRGPGDRPYRAAEEGAALREGDGARVLDELLGRGAGQRLLSRGGDV